MGLAKGKRKMELEVVKTKKGPAVVEGVRMEWVKEAIVDATLGAYGVAVRPKAKLADKVRTLVLHMRTHAGEGELGECGQTRGPDGFFIDGCGGASDMRLEACPFCGAGGELGVGQFDEPEKMVEAKGVDKEELVGEEERGVSEGEVESVSDRRDGPPAVGEPEETSSSMMVPAVLSGKLNGKSSTFASVVALDKAVEEIKRLQQTIQVSAWRLGDRLRYVFTEQLWKARTGEDHKVAYENFQAWTKAELNITKNHAFVLMRVAQNFSEDQVSEFGPTKLNLILQAPIEQREQLLERAKGGATKLELDHAVRDPKKDPPRLRDRGALPKLDPHPTKISVALVEGHQTIRLFCKPTKKGEVPSRPAKKMGDFPVGWLDMPSGVRQFFQVIATPAGEWKLRIETHRVEAEDEAEKE